MIKVAGAPVSFGVFELAPEGGVDLVLPDELCDVLHRQDYVGVDMGPIGFLGRGQKLRDRLDRHGLELAGGWIDLPFSDNVAFSEALGSLDTALDVFSEAAEASPEFLPLPTLACSGSPERRANPGGGPRYALTASRWEAFAENVMTAADRVRARGFEPTFHHHACTYVETPEEIDELLARTDIGLTLDTGHLIPGGGEPVAGWRRWGRRVNHLHLKDARVDVLRAVIERKSDMRAVWTGKAFVPLGAGDLDVSTFMTLVAESGYQGWLVIEQDTIPAVGDDPRQIEADHRTNREALRKWL